MDFSQTALYELSSIFLFDTTHLTFYKNKGVKGGAIYYYLTSLLILIPLWNPREFVIYKCLFRYHHASKGGFKGSVIFDNNTAARNDDNAIFTTTLQVCQDSSSFNFSRIPLDWQNFSLQGNNDFYITTDPVSITVDKMQWENVSPGIMLMLLLR